MPGANACTDLPGAVQPTFALTGADVGSRMRVRVKAINAGGSSTSAGSQSTAVVESASAGFKLDRVSKDRKRGLARIVVSVPAPGALSLRRTAKVKGDQSTVDTPRVVKLTLKPRGAAKSRLRRRGKAKVRAFLTFAPDGGAAVTQEAPDRARGQVRRGPLPIAECRSATARYPCASPRVSPC